MADHPAPAPPSGLQPKLRLAATPHEGEAEGRQLELTLLDVIGDEAATGAAREAEIKVKDVRLIFCTCPTGQHQHDGPCKILPSTAGTINCIRPA